MEKDLPAPRIPVSTYRLQFNHLFRFPDADAIVPYLHELGITDVYSSPCLTARKGSMHGYDIVDPTRLNPEVGTEEEYGAFVRELERSGMGLILDIVPNHMCCESDNAWWMDVLENGPCSRYAWFFDIDWNPAVKRLSGKLLLPILGDQYGRVLENQELKLLFEEGAFFVYYYEQRFPVLPETYLEILQHRQDFLRDLLCEDNPHLTEFLSIMTALRHLPPVTEEEREKIEERYREKEIVKKRLLALYRESTEVRDFIEDNVALFNGTRGDPRSFALLDSLLTKQVWRLSHWRVATEEINYRRFFDINNISAIRMENPAVFDESHSLILRLVKERKITGLRVDHPDGLYDPSDYFDKLQSRCFDRLVAPNPAVIVSPEMEGQESSVPRVHRGYEKLLSADPQYKPFYIVGEKILTKGEKVPEDWPVFGTTGYVFLTSVNGIFVVSGNAKPFDRLYAAFTGSRGSFPDVAYEKKKLVMQSGMAGEINTLGHYLNRISEKSRHTRDFTLNSLTKAITEVIAFFPVYRTYIRSQDVQDRDRQYIEATVSKAKRKNPAMDASIFDFLADVLLLRFPDDIAESDKAEWLDFVQRFQQLTSPVMAKGVEDTSFYVYNRLVSLNEVGGSPDRFGQSLEAFHGQNLDRGKLWPHALSATSTHDTKRSEDVRARINVLSEIPSKWRACIARWNRVNRKKKRMIEGVRVPERNEEYLFYQTLIGSWPAESAEAEDYASYMKRIRDYMIKALREAKVNSSWIRPNEKYEAALLAYIDAVMDRGGRNEFLEDFLPFQEKISFFGMLNSLSQTLLKMTVPGVPDFYQGTELWYYRLVDPDNRDLVDYDKRMAKLDELKAKEAGMGTPGLARQLALDMKDGAVKLYLIWKALNFRRENRDVFDSGEYVPLEVIGERTENICAFAKRAGRQTVITVVPRFMVGLLPFPGSFFDGRDIWRKSDLILHFSDSPVTYRNIFTGEILPSEERQGKYVLPLSRVFENFPVALLSSVEDQKPKDQ